MKIAYCGYDFFHACLRALLVENLNVHRAFTFPCDNRYNFNQYIRAICSEHEIPLSEQRVDESIIRDLEADGCELLITAGYRYKIPDLGNSTIKGINIHPALLPIGRGIWPLPWTILTDQKQSGVSIHRLTENYDSGDILLQRSFSLDRAERLESLSVKVQLLAKFMLHQIMVDFDHYWNKSYPQNGDAVVWNMPDKMQRTLDWEKGIDELDRICRAFGKFGCFASFENRSWVVYGLTAWKEPHQFPPGSVVHKTNTETIIAAADGLVSLLYFEAAQ